MSVPRGDHLRTFQVALLEFPVVRSSIDDEVDTSGPHLPVCRGPHPLQFRLGDGVGSGRRALLSSVVDGSPCRGDGPKSSRAELEFRERRAGWRGGRTLSSWSSR